MNCIETKGLSFQFEKDKLILDNIDLQVPSGAIYGFLGPNGAGKTTTLKLILGLLKRQYGTIHLFGKPFDANRIEILRRTGSLIESPSFYSHLTAKENLRILQKVYQCPAARIDAVLETVGLADTGSKKAGKFSLGMKQRLSIAIALLHSPELLILDEPTNGLDPNGMIEIRELLIDLNTNHNITVLVSSHLLSEIEKFVTHVGIINKGALLFQGTLDELNRKQHQQSMVRFETNDSQAASRVFAENNLAPVANNGFVDIPNVPKEQIALLNEKLVSKGISVYQISIIKNDLETIFIDLINN